MLDSVGCGELPDAAAYGDQGSDTLGNIARRVGLRIPTLRALGLGRVADLGPPPAGIADEARATARTGAFGRMAEASPGKDSVTGHWEMMGVVLDRAFPTFPEGFPAGVISELERRIGRRTIGNVAASGTEIVDRLGPEHVRTGRPIVYTSADSVFQVAAHEDVIALDELYRICETAFDLVCRGLGVGRVIARPFAGSAGAFRRTPHRRDYALEPPADTLLDLLSRRGTPVTAVGKVHDLFAGRGFSRAFKSSSDDESLDGVLRAMEETAGLIFANLVDFDAVYGHRNDVVGYAAHLEHVDTRLGAVVARLKPDDLLVVTGDHGNDPTTPSTDHSREYVPVLLAGARVRPGTHLGVRSTFADLGQTLAGVFGLGPLGHGTSFLEDLRVQHS